MPRLSLIFPAELHSGQYTIIAEVIRKKAVNATRAITRVESTVGSSEEE